MIDDNPYDPPQTELGDEPISTWVLICAFGFLSLVFALLAAGYYFEIKMLRKENEYLRNSRVTIQMVPNN